MNTMHPKYFKNSTARKTLITCSVRIVLVLFALLGIHTFMDNVVMPHIGTHKPSLLFAPTKAVVIDRKSICKDNADAPCIKIWANDHIFEQDVPASTPSISWPPSPDDMTNVVWPRRGDESSLIGVLLPHDVAQNLQTRDYVDFNNYHSGYACIAGFCRGIYDKLADADGLFDTRQTMFPMVDETTISALNTKLHDHPSSGVWLWYEWRHQYLFSEKRNVTHYCHHDDTCILNSNPEVSPESIIPRATLEIAKLVTIHQTSLDYWTRDGQLRAFFDSWLSDDHMPLLSLAIYILLFGGILFALSRTKIQIEIGSSDKREAPAPGHLQSMDQLIFERQLARKVAHMEKDGDRFDPNILCSIDELMIERQAARQVEANKKNSGGGVG